LVEQRIVERGIPGAEELKRDLGNAAKKIDVKTGELMEFYESCVPKLLTKIFGPGRYDSWYWKTKVRAMLS